ncbi:MAG: tetratricopeptide repeat protein [Verrucomicrobiota bacterium]
MARRCAWAALLALFFSSAVLAGDEMSPQSLLKKSLQLMEAGKYSDAAATMYLYLETVEDSKAPRVITIAQDIRFKLAGILIQENRLEEAAVVLQAYIDLPLGKHPRQAMKMLATCYYEYGKPTEPGGTPNSDAYENCVAAVTNALEYNENPVVVVKAISSDENVATLSEDIDETDPEYTADELILLHLTLGEALFGIKRWAESIEPFTYVIENTTDGQRKGYAIMQVVNALIKIPDFSRITEWIPQLYRTEARYDIRVNMALMNAAVALYEAGEYDSALPLYRMILPRDEVIAYQQERLRAMRIEADLVPEEGIEATEGELLLFGTGDEGEEKAEEGADAEPEEEEEKPKEIVELERLIAALEKLEPYKNNIDYRVAQIYRQVDRYWEAVRFFDTVYAVDPESELGERSIYEVVTVLIENLEEVAEAEKRGFDYMGQYKEGVTPRQIAYMLTGHYQKGKAMESVKALLPYLDGLVRTNDSHIVKYDAELYFMQGVADLMLFNYEKSEAGFKRVLDEFPASHQEGNALYWYGMSKLFLQKYENALPIFEQYASTFPQGDWIDEAYFQGGICLFGMEKYDEAMERFSLVIKNYPDSPIFAGAASMRGDLYGAGMVYDKPDYLEKAVADYKMALESAKRFKKAKQATYAVFQMAEVFEADANALDDEDEIKAKYEEIITVVQSYLDHWGAEADISKALFWIGKTMIHQDRIDEAVKTYLDAIVKFGGDVREDGVDMMITELVKVSAIWLGVAAQGQLMDDLHAALKATDDLVLQLRLRVTMAKLDYSEIELGKRLVKELPDLKSASPPVLAAICDASFEMEDYSRAEELLTIFISRFEDSDFIRAAYRLRGYGQYAEEDYEGALKTAEEALETYGHDRDVAWAYLMKAKVLLKQGKVSEARDANMYILSIPAWRGEPVAQATFQLGEVEEKDGNPRKAFGFYQRTYFQYKGHADGYWAAEAYLASARCLQQLGLEEEMRNTYLAMLYDHYVNDLPQAEVARKALGAGNVAEIETFIASGGSTNIVVAVDTGEMLDASATQTNKVESSEAETNTVESTVVETNAVDAVGTEGES